MVSSDKEDEEDIEIKEEDSDED